MMRLDFITLFPAVIEAYFDESILRRARENGLVEVTVHDLRSYTTDKHHQADDYPFGGGPGMVLKPEPLHRAMEVVMQRAPQRPLVIYPTAQGPRFNQETAAELTAWRHLVFICGHYKGVDQRAVERWVDREYSLGDFVLTGGELPAAAMADAVVRLLPGALGDADSAADDSFQGGMLGCPHYTRPEHWDGVDVPGVLTSGHHRNIELWRRITAELLTRHRRPDILETNQD